MNLLESMMAQKTFTHVSISGISTVVPEGKICIDDELHYFEGNASQARRFTAMSGLHTRRRAAENVTASDMCIQAARTLLDRTQTQPDTVDALLFVSHSADYLLPANAAIQQHALKLPTSCVAMDMNGGCPGFVNALWMAAGLIESGACRKVLILAGDTPGKFQNVANRVVGPVFGDAGTATLVEYTPEILPMSFDLGTDGARYESLVIPGGGARIPQQAQEDAKSPFNAVITDPKGNPWQLGGYGGIWMDPMDIYTFSISVVPNHIKEHMRRRDVTPDDMDRLFLHQANKIIVDGILKRVGMDKARVPCESLGSYGNLGIASIPALICAHHAGEGKNPASAGHKNSMLCGFGSGLAWGSVILSLESTTILPVQDFLASGHMPTRAECITHWHHKFSKGAK